MENLRATVRVVARVIQATSRSLEYPGMVANRSKTVKPAVIFVITLHYYGQTQYPAPVTCSEKPAQRPGKLLEKPVGSGPSFVMRVSIHLLIVSEGSDT